MTTRRHPTHSYAGRWVLSYLIPVAVAWPLYALTHSPAAAVTGVIAGFVLYAKLAGRRQ